MIKQFSPKTIIEVLPSDFQGNTASISNICESGIQVFNHNLETVKRLYSKVRPEADYEQSLNVLLFVKTHYPAIFTKSGIMLGLGETDEEVLALLKDLRSVNCDILTIGQYLKPKSAKIDVHRYVDLETYEKLKKAALEIGFKAVNAGPFVRSSYFAEDLFSQV